MGAKEDNLGTAEDAYVSYRQAAEILGIHVSNGAAHVQRGNLPTRGRDGHRPSLLRADVDRPAKQRANRGSEYRAARSAAHERNSPPDNVSDWITLPHAAGILGVSESLMRRLCAQAKEPATKVGQRWWLIRMHAENAALAGKRQKQ